MKEAKYKVADIPVNMGRAKSKWGPLRRQLQTVPKGKALFVPRIKDWTLGDQRNSLSASLRALRVHTRLDHEQDGIWVWSDGQ